MAKKHEVDCRNKPIAWLVELELARQRGDTATVERALAELKRLGVEVHLSQGPETGQGVSK